MSKLSEAQARALRMLKEGVTTGFRHNTMRPLVRGGLARRFGTWTETHLYDENGCVVSRHVRVPTCSEEWEITEAGRAALREGE